MVVIITDLLHKNHVANIFSKTGFVSLAMYLIIFGVPVFVTFMKNNYWINYAIYYEQPNVNLVNEILVYVQTTSN